jgi:hypothetical protein
VIPCPTCQKPARIVETRTPTPARTTRRYVCRGGHSFSTIEVLSPEMAQLAIAADFLHRVKELARA